MKWDILLHLLRFRNFRDIHNEPDMTDENKTSCGKWEQITGSSAKYYSTSEYFNSHWYYWGVQRWRHIHTYWQRLTGCSILCESGLKGLSSTHGIIVKGFFQHFSSLRRWFCKVKRKLVETYLFVMSYNFTGLEQSQNTLQTHLSVSCTKNTKFCYSDTTLIRNKLP
jgi:hypothetical protein